MSVYQPFTKIHLIGNVDIDVSYNHQYYFESQQAQYTFFYGKKVLSIEPSTYQNKYAGCIAVPYLAEDLKAVKYMMWKNLLNEDGTKPTGDARETYQGWTYAFVTKIEYVNPSVSNIYYALDVYQTYLFDMVWKESGIARKHCHRWLDENRKIPVPNIEDEGLNYGDSYRITGTSKLAQASDGDTAFLILSTTKEITTTSFTNNRQGGIPAQLYTYIIPFDTSSQGYSYIFGSDNVSLTHPVFILKELATDTDLVNSLVSASIVPYIPYDITITVQTGETPVKKIVYNGNVTHLATGVLTNHSTYNLMLPLGQHQFDEIVLTGDDFGLYSNFPDYSESKLLLYPYSFTYVTDMRGDTMSLKTEFINSGIGKLNIAVRGTLNFQHKIAYLFRDYLGTEGYTMDNSMGDNSADNVPIIDDYTASYLQSNSNSIRVANSNAYRTYSTEVKNANLQKKVNDTNADTTVVASEIANAIGIVGGVATLNIESALSSTENAIKDLASYSNALRSNELANTTSKASLRASYQNTLASEYAKIQDAQQVPPSASNMTGDFIFNNAYNTDKLYVMQKTLQKPEADRLTDYFNEFGYKYNRIETPSFKTRKYWDYIQIDYPNVTGNIPMDDLMAIRDIFMKGITLWHGDYIGNYTLNNIENTAIITFKSYPEKAGTFSLPVQNGKIIMDRSRTGTDTYTVTASANAGYVFSKWSDGNTSNPRTFTITSINRKDMVFEAIFTEE